MKYDIVLFDFDGTLVDTGEGITKSIKYALGCLGIVENSYENLRRFVGPPLKESFSRFYGLDEEQTLKGIEKYRERYNKKCIEESRLYDGTREMLEALKKAGVRLATASTKPQFFVEMISKALGIDGYFDFMCGSELSGARSDKKELIPYALGKLGAQKDARAVMVGDRCFDAVGARECGIDFVGVLFGFGSREELEREGCTALCADNNELLKEICG